MRGNWLDCLEVCVSRILAAGFWASGSSVLWSLAGEKRHCEANTARQIDLELALLFALTIAPFNSSDRLSHPQNIRVSALYSASVHHVRAP